MKDRAVVSERGAITIPEPIRKAAQIHPGDIMEFKTEKNGITLRHLVVTQSQEKVLMGDSDWEKFDTLVQSQKKKAQLTSYTDLEKAKQHSRKLMRKT